jgi:hypothetical protein
VPVALVDRDHGVHRVQGGVEVVAALRDGAGVGVQHRHAGAHRPHRADQPDVGRRPAGAEDLAQVRGDRQPAVEVGAVRLDDVAVVGEPGRRRRTAAPVPAVQELGVEPADAGVLGVRCGHAGSPLHCRTGRPGHPER